MAQIFQVAAECGPVDIRLSRHDNNETQMQVSVSACLAKKDGVYVQPSFTFYALQPDQLRVIAAAFNGAANELESALEKAVQ